MSAPIPAYRQLMPQLRAHQYHLVFFLWFGAVLLGGTLYSMYYKTHAYNVELSATRALDYLAAQAMQARVPSVFADRRNWMNALFIKRAWLWNTLDLVLIAATLDRTSGGLRGEKARGVVARPLRSLADVLALKTLWRWVAATLGWGTCTTDAVLVTQWCFGPSLTDRVMAYSGGQCMMDSVPVDAGLCFTRAALTGSSDPQRYAQLPEAVQRLGMSRPLRAGWHGGHDVSGHTFILVLGMLLISESLIPYAPYVLPRFSYLRDVIPHALYAERNVFRLAPRERALNIAVLVFSVALLTLWSAMLFFTSVYFHYPGEKLTGFLAASAVWTLMPKQTVLS